MRLTLAIVTVLLAVACSHSATGPTSPPGPTVDPSVLVFNNSPDTIRVIWVPAAGVTDTVKIAPNAQAVCTRWTQTFDSLYVKVIDTLPNSTGVWSEVTTPWVQFSQYPDYFQRDTVPAFGSPISNHLDAAEC
jgi:hypothetical protein